MCIRDRGKGLQAVDVSLTGQATSSDPYVRVSCEGQVAQTSVKEKTLEPRWKEILTLGPVEDDGTGSRGSTTRSRARPARSN